MSESQHNNTDISADNKRTAADEQQSVSIHIENLTSELMVISNADVNIATSNHQSNGQEVSVIYQVVPADSSTLQNDNPSQPSSHGTYPSQEQCQSQCYNVSVSADTHTGSHDSTKSCIVDGSSLQLMNPDVILAQSNIRDTASVQQILETTRIFHCDLCSATFNRQGNYTRHRMIHTVLSKDDYRYSCGECGRLFLQKCDLKRHESVHSGSEPYRCSVCSKGYIRQSDLRVHMKFHNKERSHQCEGCDKAFYQSGDLKRHFRLVHLQQKPLTCGHCTRRFAKESTLIRHMQTSHRDIIMKSLTNHTHDAAQTHSHESDIIGDPQQTHSHVSDIIGDPQQTRSHESDQTHGPQQTSSVVSNHAHPPKACSLESDQGRVVEENSIDCNQGHLAQGQSIHSEHENLVDRNGVDSERRNLAVKHSQSVPHHQRLAVDKQNVSLSSSGQCTVSERQTISSPTGPTCST